MGLLSRQRVPERVRALVPAGERLRAWATGPPRLDGEPTLVVATDCALYAPGYIEAMDWDQVQRAAWEEPVLEIVRGATDALTPSIARITLDAPGSIPEVVRERVSACIVVQRHVELVGDRGVRLVARRVRQSDEIRWSAIFDAGLDPTDPNLRHQADQSLRDYRASLGI